MIFTPELGSYFVGFCTATLLIVYILRLPEIITGANKLVHEYYYEKAFQSFLFDLILVYIYLYVAKLGADSFRASTLFSKALSVIITTIILSSGFMLLFLRQPEGSSFFASWFHKAGFNAVIYDVVIVTSVYLLSETSHIMICA
tara:strand:+ start:488 stop:919 length:432 start_codon:yes stop_codon:yes gene_type:complete